MFKSTALFWRRNYFSGKFVFVNFSYVQNSESVAESRRQSEEPGSYSQDEERLVS